MTGVPQRALNVLMYPYLPSNPNNNFEWMQALAALNYASAGSSDVLLNVVITSDEAYDIYTPANYPTIYGTNGFDIVEADMIMLQQIVNDNGTNHIRSINNFDSTAYWPAAVNAVTWVDTPWAVPHWMCTDYLFGRDPKIADLTTFGDLNAYLAEQPAGTPPLIGNFNGHWRLVGLYLDAYADLYGYENIGGAFTMPPDDTAISNIAALTSFCAIDGVNNCTNDYYHDRADGTIAAAFAQGGSATYVGFSEQSFYVLLNEADRSAPLYATEVSYGTQQTPMLYVDAFTINATTCPSETPCDSDVQGFFDIINSPSVITATAYSWDLNLDAPPRRLLVARQDFWAQDIVRNDALYAQFLGQVQNANAFPNTISADVQGQIYAGVCSALKTKNPNYAC